LAIVDPLWYNFILPGIAGYLYAALDPGSAKIAREWRLDNLIAHGLLDRPREMGEKPEGGSC
jgi:hypothetical protein